MREGSACRGLRFACGGERGFGSAGALLGGASPVRMRRECIAQCRHVGGFALARDEREFGVDAGELGLAAGEPLARFGERRFKRGALRPGIGERTLSLRERRLGAAQRFARRGDARLRRRFHLDRRIARGGQFRIFRLKPGRHARGIVDQSALALEIAAELLDPPLQFRHALADAPLLGLELLARGIEPLQHRARLRLRLPQPRQRSRRQRLQPRGFRLRGGALGDVAHVGFQPPLGIRQSRRGVAMADQREQRLVLPDLPRQIAVARRLPRLFFQAVDLRVDLLQDVLEAVQIVLRRFEPQLRLVPARMQARHPRRLLQNPPALLRLCRDDLADLSLAHEGRRARAGRGVGKEQLHVAGAHLAAVDAVGRALLALDAAGDFELVGIVEGGRRLALGIVDEDVDLGHVARRPAARAGEDHVLHAGGAHRLERGLAHDPAHRLDEVRLAAAVRADDAGEPGLVVEVGRLDEAFEADEAEFFELHAWSRARGEPHAESLKWPIWRHFAGI